MISCRYRSVELEVLENCKSSLINVRALAHLNQYDLKRIVITLSRVQVVPGKAVREPRTA